MATGGDYQPLKVGDLRPSQMLFTFGIGSLVDLPSMSVMVMGLDDWNKSLCTEITEERLLHILQKQFGPHVKQLMLPPAVLEDGGDNPFGDQVGVPVAPFPRWVRCPRCDLLSTLDSGMFALKKVPFHPDRTRFVHSTCPRGSEPRVLPVRFLVACKNGHISDFAWLEFVHRRKPPCKPSILRLREFGISGEAQDIVVKCDTCGLSRRVGEAVGAQAAEVLPPCPGHHPHLRTFSEMPCMEQSKMILIGASNSWFPITFSVLTIPRSVHKLSQLVESEWAKLQKASSLDSLHDAREMGIYPSLIEYSDDEIWDTIQQVRDNAGLGDGSSDDIKLPEWGAFSTADSSRSGPDFALRKVQPPSGYEQVLDKVVLVERLREVRAITGFTRIESPGDFLETGELNPEQRVPLTRKTPEWLPAGEVRGEGLFLQFSEDAIAKWSSLPEVVELQKSFFDAHKSWRSARNITPTEAGFPGMRYVLLHSMAHALIRQLSLDCGYTAASIRERIYSRSPTDEGGPMAGFLIYTAATDSEGTLGGLVALGEPLELGRHLGQALEYASLCSSDPLCSEHVPDEETTVNAAACHACLYVPETSCERGNKYLDRSTLVETFTGGACAYCGSVLEGKGTD